MKRPTLPGPTERVLVRPARPMALRLTTATEVRHSSPRLSWAVVEWAGRVGHPSSYALLRGSRTFGRPGIRMYSRDSGSHFKESLAGPADEVFWGLPPEFEHAVLDIVEAQPQPVNIGRAAYGVAGSSTHSFRCVALLLCHALTIGLPTNDEDVWKLFDRCWNEA